MISSGKGILIAKEVTIASIEYETNIDEFTLYLKFSQKYDGKGIHFLQLQMDKNK